MTTVAMFWDFGSAVSRSGRQQVTVSRHHQSAEICSNRSSCRIRSSRSKHREIARDAKEDVALHDLSFDTSPKLTLESSDNIRVGTERLHCTEPTTQSIMNYDDDIRKDLHVEARDLRETAHKHRERLQWRASISSRK